MKHSTIFLYDTRAVLYFPCKGETVFPTAAMGERSDLRLYEGIHTVALEDNQEI